MTGSIAKTSTKEAIAAVLASRFRTLRNEGNQNNEIGLPLTLLRLGPEHEAAVLEMGMYVGGEIAELARIARPRIGVVTAVQPVHLSRIGSLEAIEAAKGELLEALPAGRHRDPQRRRPDRPPDGARDRRARGDHATGSPTTPTSAPRRSSRPALDGMRFTLRRRAATRRPVAIPTLGRLSVHNALAAAAVGRAAGLTLDEIAAGLARGWSRAAPGRSSSVSAA